MLPLIFVGLYGPGDMAPMTHHVEALTPVYDSGQRFDIVWCLAMERC